MQVKADPNSLCGVSVIDRSILVQEPGKILDEDKVTAGINNKMLCFYGIIDTWMLRHLGWNSNKKNKTKTIYI